jgi:outer membrane protein OmpA-like peptidoglycan-associated protein
MPLPAFIASARPAPEQAAASMAPPDAPAAPARSASPAPAEPAASAPVAPARQREIVRVVFPFGSASLTEEAGRQLDDVAKRLKQGNLAAVISGHADARGNAAVNQKVSLARAHAVGNGLLRRGAPPASLRVEGEGADAPVASNQTADGRALNRRVDIELLPR